MISLMSIENRPYYLLDKQVAKYIERALNLLGWA